MIIRDLRFQEVIFEECHTEYKEGMDFFFQELTTLNINGYILKKISSFPSHLFCPGDEGIFLFMVMKNFFDYSIILVSRMVNDSYPESFTLLRFKNRVFEMTKPVYQEIVRESLRSAKFDSTVQDILNRIKTLRNERLAHINQDIITEKQGLTGISFSELESVTNTVNKLINSISFDVEYNMLPLHYMEGVKHPAGTDHGSDIDKILDDIALRSSFLNQRERLSRYPDVWKKIRENIGKDNLKVLNEYRCKLGLDEV